MNFQDVLSPLRNGVRANRECWPQDAFIGLCSEWNGALVTGGLQDELEPFLYLRTANGRITPWAPSCDDLLAGDWTAVA